MKAGMKIRPRAIWGRGEQGADGTEGALPGETAADLGDAGSAPMTPPRAGNPIPRIAAWTALIFLGGILAWPVVALILSLVGIKASSLCI